MQPVSALTTTRILAVFTDEIVARGGRIAGTYHDGQRLFTRSVLPWVKEIRPGDRVQAGVALKASNEAASLNPYLFRSVCRNGAIITKMLAARSLEDLGRQAPDVSLQSLREAIDACCSKEVFLETVRRGRAASEMGADRALLWLHFLTALLAGAHTHPMFSIMDRFSRGGDHSLFGLANAITSVARDTEDPELRWNLEESGGAVLVGALPWDPADEGGAAVERMGQVVSVE
jgi:hypothetical protein